MNFAYLQSLPLGVILLIVVALGLLIGSFLNVVIYRLPLMMYREWQASANDFTNLSDDEKPANIPDKPFNLAIPHSSCPKCHTAIRPWQNIPLISYMLLKGRCANCKNPIAKRYPCIELLCGLLSGLVIYYNGLTWAGAAGLVFVWCLIALTLIDIDHKLLPDSITLPLLWLGLLINIHATYTDLTSAVVGAALGYLSLWSVYWLFKIVTGKEGMGYGDFKLLAALGAWMGWHALPLIIILSSFVGAIVGIAGILLLGRDKNYQIPFGPYLTVAGFIAFIWGDEIMAHYLTSFT